MLSLNPITRRRQFLALTGLVGTSLLTLSLFASGLFKRSTSSARLPLPQPLPPYLRLIQEISLSSRPTAVAYLPDGRVVVALMEEGIRSWLEVRDATGTVQERQIEISTAPIYLLQVAPNGKELVCATDRPDGRIYRLPLETWELSVVAICRDPSQPWCRVAYAPNSQTLAYANGYDNVTLLDTTTQQEQAVIALERTAPSHPQDRAISLAFTPDGKKLAIGGLLYQREVVQVWDIATRQHTTLPPLTGVGGLCYSDDGQFLAGVNGLGQVTVRHASNGTQVRMVGDLEASWGITRPGRGGTLRFLPGTTTLLFAGDGEAGLAEVAGGKGHWLLFQTFPENQRPYFGDSHAACSQDGKKLLLHDNETLYFYERN